MTKDAALFNSEGRQAVELPADGCSIDGHRRDPHMDDFIRSGRNPAAWHEFLRLRHEFETADDAQDFLVERPLNQPGLRDLLANDDEASAAQA